MNNFDQNIETVTGHGTIHKTHGVAYQDISDRSFHHNGAVYIPRSGKRTIVTVNYNKEPRSLINGKTVIPILAEDVGENKLMLYGNWFDTHINVIRLCHVSQVRE